jgi:glucose repression regulatory protein TUP1
MSFLSQHRSIHPNSSRTPGPTSSQLPSGSNGLAEAFQAIKQEFDAVQSECNALRTQRDEYESKCEFQPFAGRVLNPSWDHPLLVTSQLSEINGIRRSLYDLEAQHGKVRQHYEDEISRLRAEITNLRLGTPRTASSLVPPGIPGLSPPNPNNTHAPSGSATIMDTLLRDRDRGRTKERGRDPMPPDYERDREKSRERREVDRALGHHNAKQRKSESIGSGMRIFFLSKMSHDSSFA